MDKIALVTGGNSGIGYATAKLLATKGYRVVISGRDPEKLRHAATELGVDFLVADMGDSVAVKNLAAPFRESGLDLLVNNAAQAKFFPIEHLNPENFDEFFHTNVRGPLELIRELLPALEKRQGSITTVSSVIVTKGVPNASLYAATKGSIDAFTRSLALELAPKKIRINAVAPGAIDTPIFQKIGLSPEQAQLAKARHEANIPLRRYGTPAEVAQVIVAQLESSYLTGTVWKIDGGVDC